MNSTSTLTDRGVLCGNHGAQRVYHGSSADVKGCFRGNVHNGAPALDRNWGDMRTVQERQAATLGRAYDASASEAGLLAELAGQVLNLLASRQVEPRYAATIEAYAKAEDITSPKPTVMGLRTAVARLSAMPMKPKPSIDVPAGRYAVTHEGTLKFYRVDKPTEGRWKGFTFVKVQASSELHNIRSKAAREEILSLIAVDPKAAMIRYGKEIGSCGHCGRTLTNAESREAGIGPICASKMSW